MTKLLAVLAATITWLVPVSSLAQSPSTVGELLDQGGVKLSRDETHALVKGATVTGLQFANRLPFKMTHKADGGAEGHGSTPSAWVGGTWNMNDQGQVCTNLRSNTGGRFGACSYLFKLGDAYFGAPSDARTEQLFARTITK